MNSVLDCGICSRPAAVVDHQVVGPAGRLRLVGRLLEELGRLDLHVGQLRAADLVVRANLQRLVARA